MTLVSGVRSVLLPYDTGGELNNVSARPFTGTYLDAKSVKQGSVNGRSPERSRCSTHHGVTSLEDSSFRQIFFTSGYLTKRSEIN